MAINTNLFELKAQCEEWVGQKGGLALTKEELNTHVPDNYKKIFSSQENHPLRIRSEEVEDLIENLAINLGIFESRPSFSTIDLMRSTIGRENENNLQNIAEELIEYINLESKRIVGLGEKLLRFDNYFNSSSYNNLSFEEKMFAHEFISSIGFGINNSVWTDTQIFDDIIELQQLFNEKSTIAPDGHFFDQRYIKYLNSQFTNIDKIHWRKFEELTAEFFLKHGYEVELGKGTNDGGVDIRIWSDSKDPNTLRLVQCKRWKNPVDIEFVKAFAYDVQDQNAEKGFMVTTNRLALGAKTITAVRDRKIIGVERDNIKQWLKNMREPDRGTFVGAY
ncbi:restriction endonuclease [Enterococcus sp. BWB1-3]|uniref:restriction endonuclease n=1 Tax=Enterococcus sp. BWB1-3 TaxID=2787713 RepID=UPI0019246E5C|nr:restriction endonuclease [Enterococcus sp. BWB1-3]MBL1228437.1 restriction endonuclease [Enterococcus sp. BWB1-3]